ncbi:MAG TPA: serine/threonine-protein kinase, partial [Urbifossiella sp.]|nr:serine/threonine-protein kinase [Urbifossiella sp.]
SPSDERTAALSHAPASDSTGSLGHTGPGAAADPAVPERLGKYRVVGVLGRGGMGVVYRAEDPVLRRTVALKVLPARAAADPVARERFLREARAQAAVEHDHVVAIYEVVDDAAVPFLAMPVLRGLTLADALRANPQPPVAEAVRIAREAADGLAAAHATGLVHRDIKPGNIWLEAGRLRVKLLDFGLARAAGDADPVSGESLPADAHLTQTGAVIGTPAYMSPEQALGRPLDHRTDLFSLGVVLYQMVAGRPPFPGKTAAEIMAAVVRVEPVPVAEVVPGLPPALADLIGRLLAKNPAARPPTAAAVAAALQAVELGLTSAVLPAAEPWGDLAADTPTLTEVRPAVRRPQGSRWVPVAVGVLGVCVVAAAVTAVMWGRAATETAYLDIDDAGADAVELTLKRDGVPVAERTRERMFALPPGVYTVEVSAPDPAVKLSGGLVTLGRGGLEKLTLRVNQREVVARKLDDYNPDDPEWLKLFLKQPPRVQVDRFTRELQRLNPGWDGKLESEVEAGKVVMLSFKSDEVADLSPVRAMRELTKLTAYGSGHERGRVVDLSHFRGLRLTHLDLYNNAACRSAEPLRGIPLSSLSLTIPRAAEVRAFRGMGLQTLFLYCLESTDGADLRACLAERAYLNVTGTCHNLAALGDLSLIGFQASAATFLDPGAARLRADHIVAHGWEDELAKRGQYLRGNPHLKQIDFQPPALFWAFHDAAPRPLAASWRVLGPCKPTVDDPFDPAAKGGVLPTEFFAAPVSNGDGPPLSWKASEPDKRGLLDPAVVVGRDETAAAWLHATFKSDGPGRAVLFTTGNSSYRVWVNGVPVVTRTRVAASFPYTRTAVLLDLPEGVSYATVRTTLSGPEHSTKIGLHLHRLRPGEAPPAGIEPPAPPPK